MWLRFVLPHKASVAGRVVGRSTKNVREIPSAYRELDMYASIRFTLKDGTYHNPIDQIILHRVKWKGQ